MCLILKVGMLSNKSNIDRLLYINDFIFIFVLTHVICSYIYGCCMKCTKMFTTHKESC